MSASEDVVTLHRREPQRQSSMPSSRERQSAAGEWPSLPRWGVRRPILRPCSTASLRRLADDMALRTTVDELTLAETEHDCEPAHD